MIFDFGPEILAPAKEWSKAAEAQHLAAVADVDGVADADLVDGSDSTLWSKLMMTMKTASPMSIGC